jgi:hypothetical protein
MPHLAGYKNNSDRIRDAVKRGRKPPFFVHVRVHVFGTHLFRCIVNENVHRPKGGLGTIFQTTFSL